MFLDAVVLGTLLLSASTKLPRTSSAGVGPALENPIPLQTEQSHHIYISLDCDDCSCSHLQISPPKLLANHHGIIAGGEMATWATLTLLF